MKQMNLRYSKADLLLLNGLQLGYQNHGFMTMNKCSQTSASRDWFSLQQDVFASHYSKQLPITSQPE